jgi:hypothetical protein
MKKILLPILLAGLTLNTFAQIVKMADKSRHHTYSHRAPLKQSHRVVKGVRL